MTSFDGYMVSYAQHGEDVVLRRVFNGRTSGFYIDIGANDPVADSVTKYFSVLGWRGVNVEPLAALHARLVADRPNDVNLCAAVSDKEGSLELLEPLDNHLLATATESIADLYRTEGRTLARRVVPCLTLAALCERFAPADADIDFLKIDVEGHEESVLRSGDWSRFRPRVVIVEAYVGGRHTDFPMMAGYGYVQVAFDGLNRWYVRQEEAQALGHFFAHPANTFDKFIRNEHADAIRRAALLGGATPRDAAAIQMGREWEQLGPVIRAIARRLGEVKEANPRLKHTLKRVLAPYLGRV